MSGSGNGVTSHQMALTAVVEGLSALTRPSPLLALHHVEWDEPDERVDEYGADDERADGVPCDLAAELAYHQHRGEEVRAEAQGEEATLAVAVSRFLAERWDDMHAFDAADEVISTLDFGIGWYDNTSFAEMAPAGIVDELAPSSAAPSPTRSTPRPTNSGRVVTDLLNWLAAHGHIDADAARDHLAAIAVTVDERASLKEFVDAFGDDDLVRRPDRSRIEDEVGSQYLTIGEVTAGSLTFKDDDMGSGEGDCPVVGPVPVRPEITAQARTGGRILLSAVKVGGQWGLVEVVSGDP
ncbi:hypothetical protein [Streptomyces coeruleorubidus]|uniref:hypothetical protein n=1 Tax=Streptomyces coeruleorubidus TaxID=116188 RepID=UPI0036BAB711